MSSYRPICDTWLLARSKVKFYGAYPGGFLHRARQLLGVHIHDPVLHVCSGRVEEYPYDGFGDADQTVDVNPELGPDFLLDITAEALPPRRKDGGAWFGVLADPPYTEADARHYGDSPLPSAQLCLDRGLEVVGVGSCVGILHYVAPRPPKGTKLVALVTVLVGYKNRARLYSVYEKR